MDDEACTNMLCDVFTSVFTLQICSSFLVVSASTSPVKQAIEFDSGGIYLNVSNLKAIFSSGVDKAKFKVLKSINVVASNIFTVSFIKSISILLHCGDSKAYKVISIFRKR